MRPSPKSLVLDLLSTLRGGSMPVSALVAAGELFGIAGNSLRVALARLRAAGRVESDERGRYRLGRGAAAMERQVHSWRRVEARLRPWRGGWVAAHTASLPGDEGAAPTRAERRRCDRALRLLGLAELAPGLAVRPDNLAGGAEALRGTLAALAGASAPLVFEARELGSGGEQRARSLWDVAALGAAHAETRRELEASEARLASLPEEEAMVESFLVGGRAIRQLVRDPLLPEAIDRGEERAALLAAMRRYDRAGRERWARFMARFGAPHTHAPADTRLAEGAGRLPRAEPMEATA